MKHFGASTWYRQGDKFVLRIDHAGIPDPFECFDSMEAMERRAIEIWGEEPWREICRDRRPGI